MDRRRLRGHRKRSHGASWSRVGSSFDDDVYYGPGSRFQGVLGAVVVLPRVITDDEAARLLAWSSSRFGVAPR